jgi:hypothetical protein
MDRCHSDSPTRSLHSAWYDWASMIAMLLACEMAGLLVDRVRKGESSLDLPESGHFLYLWEAS